MKRAISLFLAAIAIACSTDAPVETCKNIPTGGCPLSHGVACDDPSCAAAYACTTDGWVLDHTCPPHDAGPDTSIPIPDAGARDVSIDVPGANGGPGCAPLEPPDCPLGTALACPPGSCCDCLDLFVCDDGGWDPWGTCDDGGVISSK